MNFHIIDIGIILFLFYFTYSGFKNGLIKELSSIISYIAAFLLSKSTYYIISNYLYLELFIPYDGLRDKIGYLLSFIIIVYLFKIISQLIEKLVDMKWQNKILGLILGLINGVLIFALVISIFESIPFIEKNNKDTNTISIHEDWQNKSSLYAFLDTLQKEYLVEYVNKKTKNG